MKSVRWVDRHIETEPAKKPKKISGTYFAAVLGIDPWKTPFEAWCKSTRTFEKPFEGNEYTCAGEIIEPKVYEFLKTSMGFGDRVKSPTDIYGKDYFKKTWGDFFPDDPIFSGMWDFLILTEDYSEIEYIVEVKTVYADGRQGSLEERWKDGEAPHYQALQASLYANRKGIAKVLMVAVPLYREKGDYDHPEQVEVSFAKERVYLDEFRVSERYPNFDMYIEQAAAWWNAYVLTGKSPEYDEKKDAEILKALRTNSINPESDIYALVSEAETLTLEIEAVTATVADKEKRLETVTDQIKSYALGQFREGDKKVEIKGSALTFTFFKTVSDKFDDKAFKEANPEEYAKFLKPTETVRLTKSQIKEEK